MGITDLSLRFDASSERLHKWQAAEIERLRKLVDSEGSRAVEYLRRARKAEAALEIIQRHFSRDVLKACATFTPNTQEARIHGRNPR